MYRIQKISEKNQKYLKFNGSLWNILMKVFYSTGLSAYTHVELPYYSKFILIAAYLASYNPARTDKRFFLKVSIWLISPYFWRYQNALKFSNTCIFLKTRDENKRLLNIYLRFILYKIENQKTWNLGEVYSLIEKFMY